ncbi:MAG TPA: efflux RND transporter periplasmic adaptor subunit, partial [Nitrospiria bacterium]|nr:efflux RND transporter periplasmic adaptor subunit [Nitrospiria bacterium]
MNRLMTYLLILTAAAGIGLALFYNGRDKETDGPGGRVVRVERGDIVNKISETGSIEPLSVVEIKSEQSGEIKKLFVHPGDPVKTGQALAVIQQESGQARQAAQFRAALEEEGLIMELARKERDRQVTLFEKGFVSEAEVEKAEKEYESSRVKVQLARRQLLLVLGGNPNLLDQYLSRDLGSDELDRFTIASPTTGTVISLDVEEGEIIASGTSTVGGGTTLMQIADLSRMLVRAKINEVNISQIKKGMPAEIRLDAIPGSVYQATVTRISPQGEREENVVTYLITMEINEPDLRLRPSMTANVDILTGTSEGVLYLPIEAVLRKNGRGFVVKERDGETVEEAVTMGIRTESVV